MDWKTGSRSISPSQLSRSASFAALGEREYIRTETVTEMLNQCRTAYYKDPGASDLRMRREARTVSVEEELLYLREQLILAAEPEKQMLRSPQTLRPFSDMAEPLRF